MRSGNSRWLALALWIALGAGSAPAADRTAVPVDPRAELQRLDELAVQKQVELFAARQRGDRAAAEKLQREFEEIQKQRSEQIRRSRHLF